MLPDLGIRAAAIAAAGPAVALHARDRSATAAELTRVALRLQALARPPEASLFVNGRPDLAAAIGAQGVQLGAGFVGSSVHSLAEARQAVEVGVDYIVVGNVYDSASHPGWPGVGLALVREAAALGRPVIAIGGVTPARAWELHAAGAYGVASIAALWDAAHPAAAALELLAPWLEEA